MTRTKKTLKSWELVRADIEREPLQFFNTKLFILVSVTDVKFGCLFTYTLTSTNTTTKRAPTYAK